MFWHLRADLSGASSLMVHSLHGTLNILPEAKQSLFPAHLWCWVSLPVPWGALRMGSAQSRLQGTPHHGLQRPVYSLPGDKADIVERWDVFLCKVVPSSIYSDSGECLYKLRRFLSITAFPWMNTNNRMCSENCTYFKGVSFQQYPAYWVKTTIWRRKSGISVLLFQSSWAVVFRKALGYFEEPSTILLLFREVWTDAVSNAGWHQGS